MKIRLIVVFKEPHVCRCNRIRHINVKRCKYVATLILNLVIYINHKFVLSRDYVPDT